MKTKLLPMLSLTVAMIWSPLSSAQFPERPVASSFAYQNAVHPHDPGVGMAVEAGNVVYKMRVVLPGTVRPLPEEKFRLWASWASSRGLQSAPGALQHEVLVQEGTASYWVPITSFLFPTFEKEVKPGASYDLYVMKLGSVSSGVVYRVTNFVAVGPERPQSYSLADVVISLERTVRCPNYRVAVHGDGRVIYDGGQCGGPIGRKEWKIDQKRIVELLDYIYRIRFFEMEGEYSSRQGVRVEDGVIEVYGFALVSSGGGLPGKGITVRIGDYEKYVYDPDDAFSPQELSALSRMIDEVSEVAKWVK